MNSGTGKIVMRPEFLKPFGYLSVIILLVEWSGMLYVNFFLVLILKVPSTLLFPNPRPNVNQKNNLHRNFVMFLRRPIVMWIHTMVQQ